MDFIKPFLGTLLVSVFALGASPWNQEMQKLTVQSAKDAATRHFIRQQAQSALDDHSDEVATLISDSIMSESRRRALDPLLILAVAYHESHFNLLATGSHGEIGLMQIRPQTAQWIAKKYHISWRGAQSLVNPVVNIKIGAAYLSYLRDRFHGKKTFFLSAYNLGPKKMNMQLRQDVQPRSYQDKVDRVYSSYSTKLKPEMALFLAQNR